MAVMGNSLLMTKSDILERKIALILSRLLKLGAYILHRVLR